MKIYYIVMAVITLLSVFSVTFYKCVDCSSRLVSINFKSTKI